MLSKNYTSVRLEVTSHCNLNCEYCHNSEYSNRDNDMSTEEILQLIANLKKRYEINKILITGGEPLVNPDVPKIIQFITQLGIKADMVTNATLLTPKLAIELEKAGLKRIRISIDDVQKGSSLRGEFEPNFLWEKARMITNCTSIEVCIHTVCSPSNVNQLFEVYKKVIEVGARRWRVFDIGFQGNVLKNLNKFKLEEYYQNIIDSSKKIIKDYLENGYKTVLDIEINNIFRTIMLEMQPSLSYDINSALQRRLELSPCDYVADHQISIRSDGTATLCQYFHNTIFDFKKFNYDAIETVRNARMVDEYEILMKDLDYCSRCKYCLVCNSGCRARAKFLTGSIKDADPGACYLTKMVHKEIIPLLPLNTQKAYNLCLNEKGTPPKYTITDLETFLKEKGL